MAPEGENPLASVLRKIPIFEGLENHQVRRILGLCRSTRYEPDDVLCRAGTPSDEIYILIEGELAIVASEGARVATISPVTTVGEMGAITGLARVASVMATRPSSVLVIDRHQFDLVMREDSDMQVCVYLNIVNILAEKLKNDNSRMNFYQRRKQQAKKRTETLEKVLERDEARVEQGIKRAEDEIGLDRDEIRLHLVDFVDQAAPRLLVVDDDEGFRRMVSEALEGYEVLEAGDGNEALEIIRGGHVDLVLSDIKMPVMDGYRLLDTIRTEFPHLSVVAMSRYIDAEKVEGYGFDGFLGKPLNVVDLQLMVDEKITLDEV
jgi:CheY-like chemotaxis protein